MLQVTETHSHFSTRPQIQTADFLPGERLWRVRKNHRTVEAHLRAHGSRDVEVQFYYNGALVYGRRLPTRELAVAEANDRLKQLQRSDWRTHW